MEVEDGNPVRQRSGEEREGGHISGRGVDTRWRVDGVLVMTNM